MLRDFQTYLNNHWLVDKTRLTKCRAGKGSLQFTEPRLWVWLASDTSPTLVKEAWLTGRCHSEYLQLMYKEWIRTTA